MINLILFVSLGILAYCVYDRDTSDEDHNMTLTRRGAITLVVLSSIFYVIGCII